MDHKYIDEFDIVERYVSRKLAEGEIAEFEEHFVDCLECVGRLETTKAFADGLRGIARDRAAAPDRPNEILENERSTTSRKAFAVAAGVLSLIIIAAAVLAIGQVRRYGAEADQARNASTEWERRYEEERQLSATNAKDHQESERELTEQVAQLKLDLENERKTGLHDNVQVNLPIVALTSTRGPGSQPANTVTLSRSSARFVLVLALEGERGYRDYLITVLGSQQQPIWKGHGIKPMGDNTISMDFSAAQFRSGDYQLTLNGVARDGSMSVVGLYSFRVVKTP
jgi:hypothetical protein